MRGRGALLALIVCLVVAAVAIACSSGPPEPQPRSTPCRSRRSCPWCRPRRPRRRPRASPCTYRPRATTPLPARRRPRCGRSPARPRLARPGTLVLVAAGRYEGPLRTAASGAAGARITYRSDPVGAAVVVATGDEAAWRNLGDHVDIEGFTITGDAVDGLIDEGSFVRIIGNRVSGFAETCIYTGRSGYTMQDIDVIGNVVSGCGSSALDHGIYVSHPGGTVANNISYGNAGFGIHCWHNCNRLVISNNLVFDNDEGGILVGQGDSPNDGERRRRRLRGLQQHRRGQRRVRHQGERRHRVQQPLHQQQRVRQRGRGDGPADRSGERHDRHAPGVRRLPARRHRRLPPAPGQPDDRRGHQRGRVGVDIVGSPRPRGAAVDIGVYEQ